jgi:dTDP-4-dehydrorhamnose 3,5-epimerase-like enzyme
MDKTIVMREKHSRGDGCLIELFSEKYGEIDCRHSYIVFIEPGATRAGHFHKKKKELIFPVSGNIQITTKDKDGIEKTYTLDPSRKDYSGLLIESGKYHSIQNLGELRAAIVVFSDSYDLEDTFAHDE